MGQPARDVVVYINQFNLTSMLNSVEQADEIEALDDTTFGVDSRTFEPGMDGGTFSIGGFWEENAANTGTDDVFSALKQAATNPIITVGWEGEAVGDLVAMGEVIETNYSQTSPNGGLVEVSAEFQVHDGVEYGVVLHPGDTARSSTAGTNGTAVNNGEATTFGWAAFIHCWDASGTTPTLDVDIEHSADNSVWAALAGGGFAQLTTEGSERLSGTGNVNQYVRITWAIAGTSPSFKFLVVFARKLA